MGASPEIAIVYQARNLVNGHRYIGFTTQGLPARQLQHLKSAREPNGRKFRFQHALAKYGADNFVFEVLGDFDGDEDLAKLYEREAIAKYKPEYNLSFGGDGGRLAQETRDKIRAGKIGKPSPLKGTTKSVEIRLRMSEAAKGLKKTQSAKTIAATQENIRRAREACKIPVICLDDGRVFPGAVDAEKFYGLPKGKVCMVTTGQRPRTGGLRFAYYKAPE